MNRHFSMECHKYEKPCNGWCETCVASTYIFPINKITAEFQTMPMNMRLWGEELAFFFSFESSAMSEKNIIATRKSQQRVNTKAGLNMIVDVELNVSGRKRILRIAPAAEYLIDSSGKCSSFIGQYTLNPLKVKISFYKEEGVSKCYPYFAKRHFENSGLAHASDESNVVLCYCFFNAKPSEDNSILQTLKGIPQKVIFVGIVGLKHTLFDDFEVITAEGLISPPLRDIHSLRFRKFIESVM